jgi:hypothetical protein
VCYITCVSQYDQMQEQALELGHRNAAAIELVRKHCANARVEHHPLGGIGMLEQMTGLPIGMKTVKCDHAPKPPNFVGAEFLPVALSFYKNNCVGCPYRIPVGVPNLKTVAEEYEQQEQVEAERRKRVEERERKDREERHRARERRVMNEPTTSRGLIRLVNQLDEADRSPGPGEELVATVKGAPQFVTAPTAEVLLEAAAAGLSEHVLESVRVAAEAGQIPPEEALRVSAEALTEHPLDEAARTLLRFNPGVTAELLAPARRWLIHMAGRSFGLSFSFGRDRRAEMRREIWRDAFELLVERDLAGTLSTIEEMLGSERDYERERAAAAIEVLVDWQPEIAPVVAHQLVAAVGKSAGDEFWGPDQQASEAIQGALTRCLWVKPVETAQAMEASVEALTDHQRHDLFGAYDSVIRDGHAASVPAETGRIVVEACLKHTQGDWGDEARRAAYDLLELISKWQGHLLDGHAEALLSLLLDAISNKSPETPAAERANDPMWFLEKMSSDSTRSARIRDVRETIGGVAVRRPREVLDLVTTFLGEDQLQTDEAIEMRAECVWLLGFLGKRSDFIGEVMPLLYAGLVHREQLVRAWAINGLIEVAEAHPAAAIPVEFSATIPALLSDPYVIVHKTMLRAITRGVPVRDEHVMSVVARLLHLAHHYATTGNDADALDNALRCLQILGSRDTDSQTRFALNRIVARFARKLDDYDLTQFLERGSRTLLDVPEYVAALLDALQRPHIVHEPNSGDSRLREILYRISPALLLPHAAEIRAASQSNLPRNPWGALGYAEILQRLGLWDEAVQLADEIVATVPTTVDRAPERTYAERVCAWARVEAGIAADAPNLKKLVDDAVAATTAHEQARKNAKTESPWPD